jgi:acylphosphatase
MERQAIIVRGIVQGVGFRPFVYQLATRLRLHGFVRNQTGSLLIEVEGERPALEHFLADLTGRPPPLAHIEQVSCEPCAPRGEHEFRIEASEADPSSPVFISPDVATCPDCWAELFDPGDRRHGYPFLNCTNCGPRLTIITGAPYDRPRTTMAAFAMCPACRAEYEDPADRRFHAQPTACAACGPSLRLLDWNGQPVPSEGPLADFADALGARAVCGPFAFPGGRRSEVLRDAAGEVVGALVREQLPLQGVLTASAAPVADGLYRVTGCVENRTPLEAAGRGREEAQLQSLVSTHLLLGVRGGEFVSLMDPPAEFRAAAAACRNVGVWPVLVGEERCRDTMLASPIILYDYPQVAPESPGDFFDGTEIDEMLTLRIMTMTDDEKRAMAAVDSRTGALLARTEATAREQLLGLHGTVRSLRPSPEEAADG